MSMINGYITEHFIVMSGDHRRVHIDDDSIFFDDAPKLFKLNDRAIIGLTGDHHVSIALMGQLRKCDLTKASPSDIERYCSRWIKRNTNADTQFSVMIGGLTDEGRTVIIEISWLLNDYKPRVTTAEQGHMFWQMFYANKEPATYIKEELTKFSEINPINSQTCAELAIAVNERVASVDSFVSPSCDTVTIVAS